VSPGIGAYAAWFADAFFFGAAFRCRSRSSRPRRPRGALGFIAGVTLVAPKERGAFGLTPANAPTPKSFGAKGLLATAAVFGVKGLFGAPFVAPDFPSLASQPLSAPSTASPDVAVVGHESKGEPAFATCAASFLLETSRAAYGFGGAQRASAALISFFGADAPGGGGPVSPCFAAFSASGFLADAMGGGASVSSSFSRCSLPRSRHRPFSLSKYMLLSSPRFARVAWVVPSSSFFLNRRPSISRRPDAVPREAM